MDKIKYNKFKIAGAVICGLIGIAQILLIIFDRNSFSDIAWIVNAVFWLAMAGVLVLKYIKTDKAYKAYRKEIAEQEALLAKVKFRKKPVKK